MRTNPNAGLDPETQYVEIVRNIATLEFPWDINEALSFALFRTYAVPTIGKLLDETKQLVDHVQKRHDDTALLLEAPVLYGFDSEEGRTAVRRINQMHRMYDISNDDMLYTLATFVVTPVRWIDQFGWRKLTNDEITASVNYYRDLGRRMAIRDIPETYEEYSRLLDEYEAEHFAYNDHSRNVADKTMELLETFYPAPLAKAINVFSRSIMDEHLLDAFGYEHPPTAVRRLAHSSLRARAKIVAHMPPRRSPRQLKDTDRIKSHPGGYRLGELGVFPGGGKAMGGCPVAHGASTPASSDAVSTSQDAVAV